MGYRLLSLLMLGLSYGNMALADSARDTLRTSVIENLDAAKATSQIAERIDHTELSELYLRIGKPNECLELLRKSEFKQSAGKLVLGACLKLSEQGLASDAREILKTLEQKDQDWFGDDLTPNRDEFRATCKRNIAKGEAIWLASQGKLDESLRLEGRFDLPQHFARNGHVLLAYELAKKKQYPYRHLFEEVLSGVAFSDDELEKLLRIIEEKDELVSAVRENNFFRVRITRRERTVELIDEWASRTGRLGDVAAKLADVYFDLGSRRRGIELLKIVTPPDPVEGLELYDLARIEHKLGRVEQARNRVLSYAEQLEKEIFDLVERGGSPHLNLSWYADARLDVGIVDGTRGYVERIKQPNTLDKKLFLRLLVHEGQFDFEELQRVFPRNWLDWQISPPRPEEISAQIAVKGSPELACRLVMNVKTIDEIRSLALGLVLARLLELEQADAAIAFAKSIPASHRAVGTKLLNRLEPPNVELETLQQLQEVMPNSGFVANLIAYQYFLTNDVPAAIEVIEKHEPIDDVLREMIRVLPPKDVLQRTDRRRDEELLCRLLTEDPTDSRRILDYAKKIEQPRQRFAFLVNSAKTYLGRHAPWLEYY